MTITTRQRDVLALLAHGQTTKQMAQLLGIGERTVGTHVRDLQRRAGVHTRAGIVGWAMREGYLRADASGFEIRTEGWAA